MTDKNLLRAQLLIEAADLLNEGWLQDKITNYKVSKNAKKRKDVNPELRRQISYSILQKLKPYMNQYIKKSSLFNSDINKFVKGEIDVLYIAEIDWSTLGETERKRKKKELYNILDELNSDNEISKYIMVDVDWDRTDNKYQGDIYISWNYYLNLVKD